MVDHYSAHIFWSEEDKGFIAISPELPGCSAWGATRLHAVIELSDAIAAWVEGAAAVGNAIPPPAKPTIEDGGIRNAK